jgi:hypothetical protein
VSSHVNSLFRFIARGRQKRRLFSRFLRDGLSLTICIRSLRVMRLRRLLRLWRLFRAC